MDYVAPKNDCLFLHTKLKFKSGTLKRLKWWRRKFIICRPNEKWDSPAQAISNPPSPTLPPPLSVAAACLPRNGLFPTHCRVLFEHRLVSLVTRLLCMARLKQGMQIRDTNTPLVSLIHVVYQYFKYQFPTRFRLLLFLEYFGEI